MTRRRWLLLALIVALAGGALLAWLLVPRSRADDVRSQLQSLPEGKVFRLTDITHFEWDTLYVYETELHPLTGQSASITAQIPQSTVDTVRMDSEDWLLVFAKSGSVVESVPLSGAYPLPALTGPRSKGYPSDTRFVKTHCPGYWVQPDVLLTVDQQSGPPSTCP